MSLFLSTIRNKLLATFVRQIAGFGVLSSSASTHHDKVLQIPSRDTGRTIKVHVYTCANPNNPVPVLINFHGSGFVIPMHGTDDEFALRIAKDTEYTVLDVQYRLAPENPFPAGVHDAEDVVRYVLSQPNEYDETRIAVSGFSAGGNFALGLSGHSFPNNVFRHVVAFYPPVNLAQDPGTKIAPDTSGRPIPAWVAGIFDDCYCPAPVRRDQPLVSPGFIEANKFPDSVVVITCAQDGLAVEAEELVARLKEVKGRRVVHERMEECGHGWDKECKAGTVQDERKKRAYDLVVEVLAT
ncbi:Alpha/Beta hydrolase protein [Paraphoma chrysanthemicola]|uniref:Alpha/Beta hydrolase protein n=1 Tax=Paraphoma chrysanthemicola TaxID=798071 RepID=A0A8K0RGN3_9PLEO|nr:Alpha/Beta hydrolase protein [Paraphoma chrysanthemicola]